MNFIKKLKIMLIKLCQKLNVLIKLRLDFIRKLGSLKLEEWKTIILVEMMHSGLNYIYRKIGNKTKVLIKMEKKSKKKQNKKN